MFPSPGPMCHMDRVQPNPVAIRNGWIGWRQRETSSLQYADTPSFSLRWKVSNDDVRSCDDLVGLCLLTEGKQSRGTLLIMCDLVSQKKSDFLLFFFQQSVDQGKLVM